LAGVGLTAHANQQIKTLSAGQRRRLDVAMGLVGHPELLFLDEPTTGLDPRARREFHDLVHSLTEKYETTILLTTHDQNEAEKLADHIILSGGRIVADGAAEELAQWIAGEDEVRWIHDGRRLTQFPSDSTKFARDLFSQYGEAISEMEVRRATLEDTYLALVRQAESHQNDAD
jgi:ABC-2 type transport system ATP-binding protein